MENNESGAAKASLEELKKGALEHYEELATKCHHWNSLVPKAIKEYQEWISTTERLPAKPGILNYEHVYCLVYYKGEIRILPWNCEHLCWDQEDGDDYKCDPTAVTHWQPLPKPPQL